MGLASITIHGDSPVGGIEWSPNFTTSQLHYNITMPKWTKKVTVTPVSSSTPPGKITVQTIVCATAHIAAAAPTCLGRLFLPCCLAHLMCIFPHGCLCLAACREWTR